MLQLPEEEGGPKIEENQALQILNQILLLLALKYKHFAILKHPVCVQSKPYTMWSRLYLQLVSHSVS